jgi:SAM-dependent methyltransferase
MKQDLRLDLERIVPDSLRQEDQTERAMLELHLERYRWASRFVQSKRVLDLACGVGYGTSLLAGAGASAVVGVDLNADAVSYARQRYAADNVTFVCSAGEAFSDAEGFDVIVSLETLEHVPEPAKLLSRFAQLTRKGGRLIASAPTTLSSDVNVYHLHDFTEETFKDAIRAAGFVPRESWRQIQKFSPFRVLAPAQEGKRNYDVRPGLLQYYARNPRMFGRRLGTFLRYGFSNHYLIVSAERE